MILDERDLPTAAHVPRDSGTRCALPHETTPAHLARDVLAIRHMGGERRGAPRVRCFSAPAYLATDGYVATALVADVSRTGVRLLGKELPDRDSQLSLAVKLPSHELSTTGHVAWIDPAHGRCGVEIDRQPTGQRSLGLALLELAFEIETDRPAALVLADDPCLAAELCEPVRRHDYIPIAIRTPLEAMCALCRDQPPVKVAIVAPHALGMDRETVTTFLSSEFPRIACVPLDPQDEPGDLASAVREVDAVLSQMA